MSKYDDESSVDKIFNVVLYLARWLIAIPLLFAIIYLFGIALFGS
tara:strand:+ start:157 stop:291 length:135 start_codon:yes stop_codon:yes gene_type:complete